jgi:predicted nucleic acid-binding protein
MKVLVDTCVWSQALRHKNPNQIFIRKLSELIDENRVVIIGPIRQELLSGIGDLEQFKKLRNQLKAFEDISLETKYFVKAAEFSNICRKKGVQRATTDFLICSVSHILDVFIFSTDDDFKQYQKYLPIRLL